MPQQIDWPCLIANGIADGRAGWRGTFFLETLSLHFGVREEVIYSGEIYVVHPRSEPVCGVFVWLEKACDVQR